MSSAAPPPWVVDQRPPIGEKVTGLLVVLAAPALLLLALVFELAR